MYGWCVSQLPPPAAASWYAKGMFVCTNAVPCLNSKKSDSSFQSFFMYCYTKNLNSLSCKINQQTNQPLIVQLFNISTEADLWGRENVFGANGLRESLSTIWQSLCIKPSKTCDILLLQPVVCCNLAVMSFSVQFVVSKRMSHLSREYCGMCGHNPCWACRPTHW